MKKLFITGGSGAIGQAIIKEFERNNFEIIAPSRQKLNLENLKKIDEYLGKTDTDIDVFIHSAGINDLNNFEELSQDDIQKSLNINALSFLSMASHLRINLINKNKSAILAISSLYGSIARKKRAPYVLSKHSLMGIIRTLAIELGPYNINVNALSPGFVDTIMTRKNNDDQTIQRIKNSIPMGRLADTEDIAKVAYFLCSDLNTYINGQNIIVDGGFSVGGFQGLLDF